MEAEWKERIGVGTYGADLEETVDSYVKEGIAHVDSHVHPGCRERAEEPASRHLLILLLFLLLRASLPTGQSHSLSRHTLSIMYALCVYLPYRGANSTLIIHSPAREGSNRQAHERGSLWAYNDVVELTFLHVKLRILVLCCCIWTFREPRMPSYLLVKDSWFLLPFLRSKRLLLTGVITTLCAFHQVPKTFNASRHEFC